MHYHATVKEILDILKYPKPTLTELLEKIKKVKPLINKEADKIKPPQKPCCLK